MIKLLINYTTILINQIITLLFPLILAPKVTAVFDLSLLGLYSYSFAIINMFLIFTFLGNNFFGIRMISMQTENFSKQNVFNKIFSIQLITTFVTLVIFVIFIVVFLRNDLTLIIMTIILFSSFFNIQWYLTGIENYKLITISNLIVKLVTICLIYIFVNSTNDFELYVIIMSLNFMLLNFFPFIMNLSLVQKFKFQFDKQYFRSISILFIPIFIVTIYKFSDRIILEKLGYINSIAIYDYAILFISAPLLFIVSLANLMLPKAAKNYNNETYINKNIRNSLFISHVFSIIAILIIFEFDNIIITYLLGEDFLEVSNVLKILLLSIIFTSIGNVIRTQYLVPLNKDRLYIIIVSIGAVTNISLNAFLIPYFGIYGAAISLCATEFIVFVNQYYYYIKFSKIRIFNLFSIFFLVSTTIFIIIYFNFL